MQRSLRVADNNGVQHTFRTLDDCAKARVTFSLPANAITDELRQVLD